MKQIPIKWIPMYTDGLPVLLFRIYELRSQQASNLKVELLANIA